MSELLLGMDEYQNKAIKTDKTQSSNSGINLAVLGLFGEAGSLLSETKKKQRDTRSYLGYEQSVLEEIGDVLWYLAVIAKHAGITLSALAEAQCSNERVISFAELQPQSNLALHVPTTAFERTLLRLAGAVSEIASITVTDASNDLALLECLRNVFQQLLAVANEAGVTLEQAAAENLKKIEDRWPATRILPPLFDCEFPDEECLPRKLTVDLFERKGSNEKTYVMQRCNELFIGDRLTDNIIQPDDYRFHDAFHYAYAAVLGWSPVTRALFKRKRKSAARVDEGEDGARAILIEEGVATYVFGVAKHLDFFAGQQPGDLGFTFLKSVRQFVRGYEVEKCPLWLWEEAILAGNEAFRFLSENRRGRLKLDLDERSIKVEALPA